MSYFGWSKPSAVWAKVTIKAKHTTCIFWLSICSLFEMLYQKSVVMYISIIKNRNVPILLNPSLMLKLELTIIVYFSKEKGWALYYWKEYINVLGRCHRMKILVRKLNALLSHEWGTTPLFDQSWTTARREINYKFAQKQAGKAELWHW